MSLERSKWKTYRVQDTRVALMAMPWLWSCTLGWMTMKKAADTDSITLTVPKPVLCFLSAQAKPECTHKGNSLIKLPCFGLAKAMWLTPQHGQDTTLSLLSTTTSETSGELDPEEAAVSYGAGIPSRAFGEVINHQTALATSPPLPVHHPQIEL